MKRRDKWLSADVQNEVIEIMSHELLRGIIQEIKHSTFFSIIADGTTDVSSSEQFSLCIRCVDPDTLHVKEIFVGLYNPSDHSLNSFCCDQRHDHAVGSRLSEPSWTVL